VSARAFLAIVALAAAGAGCQPAKPASGKAEFWTLEDFVGAAPSGSGYSYPGSWGGVASDSVVTLRGQRLPYQSPPFAPDVATQSPDFDGLNVFPGFSEGKPSAWVIAEVWTNWAPIWVQPIYVPVTSWDSANPASKLLPGALGVFSVGEASTFYSPYWAVVWAVVPEGTPPEVLVDSKAILDRASELHEGPGSLGSVAPEGLQAAQAQGAGSPVHPFTRVEAQRPTVGQVWSDGKKVSVLGFGTDRFTWDQGGIVDETPIFVLATLDETGERQALGLPEIGGVGPLYSGAKAKAPNGKPAFGSLWRVHTALVPPTAGAFVPSSMPALRAAVLAKGGVTVPDVSPQIEARADVRDFLLRVALHPACFADPAAFPEGCQFLDSRGVLPSRTVTTRRSP
jgi:hypothetical protein